jgi:hypothetical protein
LVLRFQVCRRRRDQFCATLCPRLTIAHQLFHAPKSYFPYSKIINENRLALVSPSCRMFLSTRLFHLPLPVPAWASNVLKEHRRTWKTLLMANRIYRWRLIDVLAVEVPGASVIWKSVSPCSSVSLSALLFSLPFSILAFYSSSLLLIQPAQVLLSASCTCCCGKSRGGRRKLRLAGKLCQRTRCSNLATASSLLCRA